MFMSPVKGGGWEEHLAKLRALYPDKKSDASLLLHNIRHGSEETEQRSSAIFYGLKQYTLGHRSIIAHARRLIDGPFEPNFFDMNRELFHLLEAIGHMDLPVSHEFLVDQLQKSTKPYLTGAIIDGLNWERKHYDYDLIMSYLYVGQHEFIIRCCLYSLMLHRTEGSFELAYQFRDHPEWMVRNYVLDCLVWYPEEREAIAYFLNDPNEQNRSMAQELLQDAEYCDAYSSGITDAPT